MAKARALLTFLSDSREQWGLVIAGIADINRPPENISLPQSTALSATGIIWARYATQIVPINYNLMTVNIFVGATGLYQMQKKLRHMYDI